MLSRNKKQAPDKPTQDADETSKTRSQSRSESSASRSKTASRTKTSRRSAGARGASHGSAAARPAYPWTQQMLILWAVLAVIGVVLLGVGWAQVGNETTYADQVPGLNLALAGVIVAGAGTILMTLAGRRAVVARRVAVLGDLRAMPATTGGSQTSTATQEGLVAGDGLKHFHRADCPMTHERNWTPASRSQHEQAGRVPCGVCRP